MCWPTFLAMMYIHAPTTTLTGAKHMFIGVHGPNSLDITNNDLALYHISQCNAWKLFDYHTQDHVASIRAIRPTTHFLVRLPDSRLAPPDGRYLGVEEYAAKIVGTILRFYPLGI